MDDKDFIAVIITGTYFKYNVKIDDLKLDFNISGNLSRNFFINLYIKMGYVVQVINKEPIEM